MSDEFREAVGRLLKDESTMALATTNEDGEARVAPLFYVSDDELRMYWFSSASSEHSVNAGQNKVAAVCVYGSTADWQEIRGLQMRGILSVVEDPERRRSVEKHYKERFHLGDLFDAQIAVSELYMFEPRWVRYIRGPAEKIERTL